MLSAGHSLLWPQKAELHSKASGERRPPEQEQGNAGTGFHSGQDSPRAHLGWLGRGGGSVASSYDPSTVKVPLLPAPLDFWFRYMMYLCTQAWPGSAQINRPRLVWKLRSEKEKMRNGESAGKEGSTRHPSLSHQPQQQLLPCHPPHPLASLFLESAAPCPRLPALLVLELALFPLLGGCTYMTPGWEHMSLVL